MLLLTPPHRNKHIQNLTGLFFLNQPPKILGFIHSLDYKSSVGKGSFPSFLHTTHNTFKSQVQSKRRTVASTETQVLTACIWNLPHYVCIGRQVKRAVPVPRRGSGPLFLTCSRENWFLTGQLQGFKVQKTFIYTKIEPKSGRIILENDSSSTSVWEITDSNAYRDQASKQNEWKWVRNCFLPQGR